MLFYSFHLISVPPQNYQWCENLEERGGRALLKILYGYLKDRLTYFFRSMLNLFWQPSTDKLTKYICITFVIWTNKCCYMFLVHWFTANYKWYTICALFKTTYLWLHTNVDWKKCRVPTGHLVIGATGLSGVLHVSLNCTSLTCNAVWNDTIHYRVVETICMCSDGVNLEAQNDT